MGIFDRFKKDKKDPSSSSGGVSLEKAKADLDNHKEAVRAVSLEKGLDTTKSRVVLVIDISASMRGLFRNGTVQNIVDRALALGIKFDDNSAIDVYLFGKKYHSLGELVEADFYRYVDLNITEQYSLEYDTKYAGVINMITKDLTSTSGDPGYVMFVTDGNCSDAGASEKAIIEAAHHGIFWQFIGIGDANFHFLKKLDDMSGRKVDNAGFFEVNDIFQIDDIELYKRMLNEYPEWIQKAKGLGII